MKPLQTGIFLSLFLMLFLGCAGLTPAPRVEQGEAVRVEYTCRTGNNEVMDTTSPALAKDESVAKARVFAVRPDLKPVDLTAGENPPDLKPWDVQFLDTDIRMGLAHALVGKEKGKPLEVVLESKAPDKIEDSNRYRKIQRVRTVPRVQTIPSGTYQESHGRLPEKGELFFNKNGQAHAEVIALDPDNITIRLIIDPLRTVDTPWGPARTDGDEKEVRVTIEAETGTLVRTGGLIGRISEVNEKNIVVDYGLPFGGQTLNCTVEIISDEEKE
jgi:FKBP-type peptidyl-prolyl cis-trans isomerase 2